MRTFFVTSLAVLAAFSALPASAQSLEIKPQQEYFSLRECKADSGYRHADAQEKKKIEAKCRLERLRSSNGRTSDFRFILSAVFSGDVSLAEMGTTPDELFTLGKKAKQTRVERLLAMLPGVN